MNKQLIHELNTFSIPLILNNFFGILISSLMAALVGRISMNAIASTEVVDTFIFALIGILGVGTLAFNIYASRVRLTNPQEFQDYFKSIILLNTFIGVLFVLLIHLLAGFLLKHVYGFQGELLAVGTIYAKVASLQIICNMLIFALSNQMKVRKKTKSIMLIGIFSSCFQVGISFFFIYGIFKGEAKIIGVALATTITLIIEVCCYAFTLRKDLLQLKPVISTKKWFLAKKSLPLFAQELLEGSIFSVGITALLTRLGVSPFAAYSVCKRVVAICLTPMFMYANAVVVMTGEYLSEKSTEKLKRLPVIGLSLTLAAYLIIGGILFLFKDSLLAFFTNNDTVLKGASTILLFVLFISIFQPFFELSKYSLQALGQEKIVLLITGIVNLFILALLFFIQHWFGLTLYLVLSILAANYLILYLLFTLIYRRKIAIILD